MARSEKKGGSKRRKFSSRQIMGASRCPEGGLSTATSRIPNRVPTVGTPLPAPPPMACLCWSQSQWAGMGAEQREGLSPNRGCRASLHQTQQTSRGWKPGATSDVSSRPSHEGRCVPSPTHGNTTVGENAVVRRIYCSNNDKAQSNAWGGEGNLTKLQLIKAQIY